MARLDERAVIAATLRQVAGWGSAVDEAGLCRLADAVEHTDPAGWVCCPLCQEVTCDDECALAEIRRQVEASG